MKLFSRNAEKLLNEKVASIADSHDSWRCIYINLCNGNNELDKSLRTAIVTSIIKDLMGPDEGSIYLCDDGDVFVLFQGQVTPVLARLGSHLGNLKLGADAAYSEDEQYTVFDLSKHWDTFKVTCAGKMVKPVVVEKQVLVTAPEVKSLPEFNFNAFQHAASKRAARKKLLVLIVEDDPFTRRLVNGTLKLDFDIAEAGSGHAAIKAYEELAPDAVFLDIELPDVNGHTLLNKFLKIDKSAFVVMLSANSVKENILAALENGAQGFVAKPFVKEKLLHYLRMCESSRKKNITTQRPNL